MKKGITGLLITATQTFRKAEKVLINYWELQIRLEFSILYRVVSAVMNKEVTEL